MITSLGIENFKAFGSYQEINLNNLTIISGLNSSGKSSIYQALLLLAQSENSFITDMAGSVVPTLNINGEFIKFGTVADILHDKKQKFVRFVIGWADGTTTETRYDLQDKRGSSVNAGEQQFVMSKYSIYINHRKEIEVTKISKGWEIFADQCLVFGEYKIMDIVEGYVHEKFGSSHDNEISEVEDDSLIEFDDDLDDELDEATAFESDVFGAEWTFLPKTKFVNVKVLDFVKCAPYSFEISIEGLLQCINPIFIEHINLDDLKFRFKEKDIDIQSILVINNYHFRHQKYSPRKAHILWLPPFRGYPKRVYSALESQNPLNLYNSNSKKRIFYAYDFEKRRKIKGTLEEAITYWLVDHFKIAEKIDVNDIVPELLSEIYLTMGGERIPINNVGFGASQIVPVIFRLLLSQEGIVSIVDEPEIHLHPSVQSRLADFFFVMSLTGRQMLIETHSEYILDKLIFLTLKHENLSSNVSMHWIKREGNQSLIDKIEYDELGFILNQPEDFLVEKSKLVEMLSVVRMEKIR